MEDITYADSYTHEILAMNDGSYITIENGIETLYGISIFYTIRFTIQCFNTVFYRNITSVIHCQERLMDFNGLLIAWSAGSMNCASTVYAAPELEGEAIDTSFTRWLSGLGLTETNIFPHYQSLKEDCLDGLRVGGNRPPCQKDNIHLRKSLNQFLVSTIAFFDI